MRIEISDAGATRTAGEEKIDRHAQPPTQRCRHPSYELKSMPVPNANRKFQQLVCTKCGLVAGALDLRIDVRLDKIANALARLIEKLGV
jgi:hypothetical protein